MDIEELIRLNQESKLKKSKHPVHDLYIWNYSEIVQAHRLWTPTLMKCRGLITDVNGKIVARSFNKFFNIEEYTNIHLNGNLNGNLNFDGLPDTDFRVFDKADGSLGILFHYNGSWMFSSRGSFTSEQAYKGLQMFKRNKKAKDLDTRYSYVFEIIYPENRIVVDYDDKEALIFLAAFCPEQDTEILDINDTCVFTYMKNQGFEVIEEYKDVDNIQSLKELNIKNREGHVVRYSNGLRLKIKFENYLAIHKLLSRLTVKNIFILFTEEKKVEDIIEHVPDEYHKFIIDTYNKFAELYDKIYTESKAIVDSNFLKDCSKKDSCISKKDSCISKKDFVKNVGDHIYKRVIFSMFDKKFRKSFIYDIIEREFENKFKEEQGHGNNIMKTSQKTSGENYKESPEETPQKSSEKRSCIVCDIDGTIALNTSGRSSYDMTRVSEDTPDKTIIDLLRNLKEHYVIILCSGRSEDAREDTEKWLLDNGVSYSEIHFRQFKNREPDYIVKEKMWTDIQKEYKIEFMLDDRDQVVKHARSLGFKVLQVAEGNF